MSGSSVNNGAKKFGTRETSFTAFETLYTLARCTLDLSGANCYRCLKFAIASLLTCCSGRQLGLVLTLVVILSMQCPRFTRLRLNNLISNHR